jgi:hypothetical protein
MDLDIIRRVLEALEREQVQYIVCGAVAINLLGLPRATEDLDIFVAPERENIERLKVALQSVQVSVATPKTLYHMKKGTVRPKDWGDAAALRRRFDLEEE